MDMCGQGHEDIVHNERTCPFCAVIDELESLEKDHTELVDKYENLLYHLQQNFPEALT